MNKAQNDSLLNLIKQISINAVEATKPTAFIFGTVISASPLKIKVSNNLILTEEFLVVPRTLTNYSLSVGMDISTENTSTDTTHSHIVNYEDSTIDGTTNKNVISEETSFDNTHKHSVKGTKSITIYNALKVNEKVILAQMQGGQDYIILDRV